MPSIGASGRFNRKGDAVGSPIRVGILGYGLDRPTTGIARYTLEVMAALRTHEPGVRPVLLRPFPQPVAGEDPAATVRLRGTARLPAMLAAGPVQIAAVARRARLDVVHDSTGVAPFFVPRAVGGFARVVTIHDAVPLLYPETQTRLTNLLFRRYIPHALPFVDRVIADSQATKRDLVRLYGLPDERVSAVLLGVADGFSPRAALEIEPVLVRHGIAGPYVLAVGSLEPRKNLPALFEAFAGLRAAGLPHRLVVVGRTAWKAAPIFRRLEELGLGDAVVLTGYVADADLPALYAGAACFVFPSLYEGFGLPPLEAMACGTPVVASNAASIPEVVGDAALSVDPRDGDALGRAIQRVLEDPTLAADLRRRGLARATHFSWRRTAAEHAAIYAAVVGAARGRARGTPRTG